MGTATIFSTPLEAPVSPQEPYVPGSSVTILPGVPLQGTGQQDNESSAALDDQNDAAEAVEVAANEVVEDEAMQAPVDAAELTEYAPVDSEPADLEPTEYVPVDYAAVDYAAVETDEPDSLFQSASPFGGYGAHSDTAAEDAPAAWSDPLPAAETSQDGDAEDFRLDPLFASAATLPAADEEASAETDAAPATDYSRYNMYSGYPESDSNADASTESPFAVSAHAVDEVLAAIGATTDFSSTSEPKASDDTESHVAAFPALVPTDEAGDETDTDSDTERPSMGSPFGRKAAVAAAVVVAAAAGWFAHGATSSSSDTAAPTVTHHAVLVTPVSELQTMGSLVQLKSPTVLDGQRALMQDLTSTRETPVFFGSKDVPGAYAMLGVLTGKQSPHGKTLGAPYPAVGGGTVRCGEYNAAGHLLNWCTWSDAKTSGTVANFQTNTTIENTYTYTQLVRSQMEA